MDKIFLYRNCAFTKIFCQFTSFLVWMASKLRYSRCVFTLQNYFKFTFF